MGATGILIGGDVKYEPLSTDDTTLSGWENAWRRNEPGFDPSIEHGALFTPDGEAVIGYRGEEHSVNIPREVLNREGFTLTHYHPDKAFGGTLSMQDLKVFANSKLGELRAVSGQGQLYSIKAGDNVDREGLKKWIQANQKLQQRNFDRSYESSLRRATTPLKSGPHKGQVKLTDPKTGKVTYRAPMTAKQAANYARQYSVGQYERLYEKALKRFGVNYTSTKAGKNSDKRG